MLDSVVPRVVIRDPQDLADTNRVLYDAGRRATVDLLIELRDRDKENP